MGRDVRKKRGIRRWVPPLQRRAAGGRKVEGPLGAWAKGAQATKSSDLEEIASSEGFGFRSRPS